MIDQASVNLCNSNLARKLGPPLATGRFQDPGITGNGQGYEICSIARFSVKTKFAGPIHRQVTNA